MDTREKILPSSPRLQIARATAVAVLSSNIQPTSPLTITLMTDASKDFLCADVKFASEPSLSYACTGFLVAPDLLVTAGHCMVTTGESHDEQNSYCEAFSWLFDYRANENGDTATQSISSANLYGCKKIVYAVREETPPFRDYALVQLDRDVTDRESLTLSSSTVLPFDEVSMIGYPLGQPAVLSRDAFVLLNNPNAQSFITNLDAFEGNSGSPVFNSRNEVIGLLTGGTPINSLRSDRTLACDRYNSCDEFGNHCEEPDLDTMVIPEFQRTGTIVQRIEPIQKMIQTLLLSI
ncbi:MAG: serine protease [Pseudobdellovibrionaceae bacterium]